MSSKDLRATGVSRTVEIDIAVSPKQVYDFIFDVANLGALGPETQHCEWVEPAVSFRGTNRVADYEWTTTCYVVDAQPGVRFAYEVEDARYVRWAFDLSATSGGTRVAHSFEILHLSPIFNGVADEHLPLRWQALQEAMQTVLAALKARLEGADEPAVA